MAITATPTKFNHTGIMRRVVDEAEYVLRVLHRARDDASVNPESYDPEGRKRIDEAIARLEDVLGHARLMVDRSEQNRKAPSLTVGVSHVPKSSDFTQNPVRRRRPEHVCDLAFDAAPVLCIILPSGDTHFHPTVLDCPPQLGFIPVSNCGLDSCQFL